MNFADAKFIPGVAEIMAADTFGGQDIRVCTSQEHGTDFVPTKLLNRRISNKES